MRFLHFYRVPLPDARADAIQIVNTAAGICRAGGDVTMHVETLRGDVSACLDFYGITGEEGVPPGRLAIAALGGHWSWPWFDWKTTRILRRGGNGPACLFVREVRPYVPGLMTRARAAGLRVLFEAHNVSEALVREKERRPAAVPAARSFSLVTPEGKAALRLVGEGDPHDHADHAGEDGHAPPAAAETPPNLDTTPAPAPPPPAEDSATRKLRRKAEQRAAIEREILGLADGLICTQRATLDSLRPLLRPGAPAAVLGNGTRLPRERAGVDKDIDVLYCGSLKQWKGVDTLVAAMQTLYPWKLTIVGPMVKEDVERVRQAALAVGVVERVRILPAVRPADVWDLYARARVGVIPLPGSGFIEARDFTSPLKLFEMMAAGLPIVCSRLRSLQEYLSDGREALMVTPDDPRPLAEGLRRALTDETLRAGLAAAARARAAEFTWDNRGRKLLAFAEELWRKKATSSAPT